MTETEKAKKAILTMSNTDILVLQDGKGRDLVRIPAVDLKLLIQPDITPEDELRAECLSWARAVSDWVGVIATKGAKKEYVKELIGVNSRLVKTLVKLDNWAGR